MNRKKIMTTLVSTSLLITLLAGCGSSSSSSVDTSGKPKATTFTMFVNTSDFKPIDLSATPVGKKITDITGVTLKMDYLVGSDEKTKAGVMVAAGEYPDLLNPHGEFAAFRDAGALVPIEDLIEKYGANIKKAYKGDLAKLKDADGHIYSLSPARIGSTALYPTSGFYLAKDVLKQAGYPKVTSITQYFKIIEDYLAKNPNYNGKPNIGFTAETDGWRNYVLNNAPTYLAGNPNTGGVYIDDKFEAHNYALKDWAHNYFNTLNGLWNKGEIDKEIFTQNYDAFKAKLSSGRVLGFYDERWQIQDAITSLEQQKLYDRVPFAMPVTFDDVKKESYNGISVTAIQAGICITKNCKDQVAAIKFLDAMCSEEIQKLTNWGIEGQDYSVKDGKMVKSAEQIAQMDDANYGTKQGVGMFWQFPHSNFGKDSKYSDGNFVSPNDTDEYITSKYKPYEKEVADAYKVKSLADIMAPAYKSPYGYGWDITIPDSEQDIKLAGQNTTELQKKYIAKLIMAKSGEYESIWSQYSKEMKNAKYDIGDAYYTKIIKQRMKDWGTGK